MHYNQMSELEKIEARNATAEEIVETVAALDALLKNAQHMRMLVKLDLFPRRNDFSHSGTTGIEIAEISATTYYDRKPKEASHTNDQ